MTTEDKDWEPSDICLCGKHVDVCQWMCEEYKAVERATLEDEANGIFLPSYCLVTQKQFCTCCQAIMTEEEVRNEQPICSNCFK